MMNKYTDHIKNILQCSREEARRTHSPYIRPEHFLLGIIRDGQGKAVQALQRQGINLDALRCCIELLLIDEMDDSEFEKAETTDEITYTNESDRTLKLSHLEARMLKSMLVDSEHLMLAILKDSHSPVCQILQTFDIDYHSFFKQIVVLDKQQEPGAPAATNLRASHLTGDKEVRDEEGNNSEERDEENEDMEDSYTPYGGQHQTATETETESDSATPTLDRFGFDMTQAAREGKLDPVVGRTTEIERLSQILSRRKKNNPILLGEPGVGKTAIVEGLAQLIASKKASILLKDKRLISLDLAGLVAGTKYRGQFEERLKNIMRELQQSRDVILYIDEIHTLVGAGNAQGGMDAANMLKPALSRGEIQCIGATTIDEYRKSIEKDGALERRFQKILVEPTSTEDTLTILHNIRDRYEEHHNVTFTDEALKACVTLSDRYITDRNLPDKAIDALDEAGSRMHLLTACESTDMEKIEHELEEAKRLKDETVLAQDFEKAATYRDRQRKLEHELKVAREEWAKQQEATKPLVDADKIAEVVAQMTGIPVQKVQSSEGQKLLALKETLQQHIIGQDEAIAKVVRAIQRNRVGLKDPKRPIGTFLFLGPTGVGKTYLAKKIADELFATKDSLIRIDMSEFMEKHSSSRLIGAAPGYIGYDEGGQLTERVRRHPYSVVLFDEIEKADHEVFNLLLQLFDEGHLTDAQGRKTDFKNCIIIMTSNVGSRQLGDFGTGIGFQSYTDQQQRAANEAVIQKELKKTFSPEFINRIDDIITFQQLGQGDIRRIVDLELEQLLGRMEEQGYQLEVSEEVKDYLGEKGYDKKYGARPLKRAIQQYVEDALCEGLLMHQGDEFRHIKIEMEEGTPKASFC